MRSWASICLPLEEKGAISNGAVKLNVGGASFDTTWHVLNKCPKLAAMASSQPMSHGTLFVDRDARYFGELLTFLRDGPAVFKPPALNEARMALIREAAFFDLPALSSRLREASVGILMPSNEEMRVAKLKSLRILDSNGRDFFHNKNARMVGAILETPVVWLSLIDSDTTWFKISIGMDVISVPRASSICAWNLLQADPKKASMLLFEDTFKDPRTAKNPFVSGSPNLRFYAASPLVTSDGFQLGSLSVADMEPRSMSLSQAHALANFSQFGAQELEREHLLIQEAGFDKENMNNIPDFSAGPLRAKRMHEALTEAVCLIQIRCDSMDWRILYGNRQFSDIFEVLITPPERLSGIAIAEGAGLDQLPKLGDPLNLWDWLQLTDKSEQQVMQELHEAWQLMDCGVFAIAATMPAPQAQHASADRIPVRCRFSPYDQLLDVAAPALPPNFKLTADFLRPPQIMAEGGHLYFMTMVTKHAHPMSPPQRTLERVSLS